MGEWLKRGIVDVIVGQVYSSPELHDSCCQDFSALVALAKAAGGGCAVHAALQSHVDSDRVQEATAAMIRGGACNYYAQGVDGLYLAHWFNNWSAPPPPGFSSWRWRWCCCWCRS